MPPTAAIILTLTTLAALLGATSWAARSGHIAAETSRKIIHVGMGLICLSFPWLFQSTGPVQLLAAIAIVSLLLIRAPRLKKSVGHGLFAVSRISIGELLFPLAVAWIFTLSDGDPLLFTIPILQLTLADAAGAIVGTRIGKRLFKSSGGTKSFEGSLAFFLVALACAAIPLALHQDALPLVAIIAIPLLIALFVTAVEGISGHGLDNLLIPFGSWLLLDYYLELETAALLIRVVVLLAIAALLTITARKSAFDGGALLAAALFGFGAFTLGGLWCLIAALLLFLLHLIIQGHNKLTLDDKSSIGTLLAIALPSLPWLTLARSGQLTQPAAATLFILTIAALAAMIFSEARRKKSHRYTAILGAPVIGVLIITTAIPLTNTPYQLFISLLPITVASAIYYAYRNTFRTLTCGNDWAFLAALATLTTCINIPLLEIALS